MCFRMITPEWCPYDALMIIQPSPPQSCGEKQADCDHSPGELRLFWFESLLSHRPTAKRGGKKDSKPNEAHDTKSHSHKDQYVAHNHYLPRFHRIIIKLDRQGSRRTINCPQNKSYDAVSFAACSFERESDLNKPAKDPRAGVARRTHQTQRELSGKVDRVKGTTVGLALESPMHGGRACPASLPLVRHFAR